MAAARQGIPTTAAWLGSRLPSRTQWPRPPATSGTTTAARGRTRPLQKIHLRCRDVRAWRARHRSGRPEHQPPRHRKRLCFRTLSRRRPPRPLRPRWKVEPQPSPPRLVRVRFPALRGRALLPPRLLQPPLPPRRPPHKQVPPAQTLPTQRHPPLRTQPLQQIKQVLSPVKQPLAQAELVRLRPQLNQSPPAPEPTRQAAHPTQRRLGRPQPRRTQQLQ